MILLRKVFFVVLVFLLVLPSLFISHVFAQTTPTGAQKQDVLGVATMGVGRLIDTVSKNVKDGNILSSSDKGPVLSTLPYDPQVLGVVSQDAAILLNSTNSKTSVPVISVGNVYVLVSTKNGVIKNGDLITTSTIPGVGVKAGDSGYVLGRALEDYTEKDPKKIGKVAMDLDLHYFNAKPTFPGSLTDIFKIAFLPSKTDPTPIFKAIVAAIVIISSFILGFMSFGRTAAKGVEALGRNPAASRIIHLGIIFNITIVVVIVLSGMTIAFLILRL